MNKLPEEWAEAMRRYPNDPIMPDGMPFSIRVGQLVDEGLSEGEAQDVAEAEAAA